MLEIAEHDDRQRVRGAAAEEIRDRQVIERDQDREECAREDARAESSVKNSQAPDRL